MFYDRNRNHFCSGILNIHGLSMLASMVSHNDAKIRQYILDSIRDTCGIDLTDSSIMKHLTPDQVVMLKAYELEHADELVEDFIKLREEDRAASKPASQAVASHPSFIPKPQPTVAPPPPPEPRAQHPPEESEVPTEDFADDLDDPLPPPPMDEPTPDTDPLAGDLPPEDPLLEEDLPPRESEPASAVVPPPPPPPVRKTPPQQPVAQEIVDANGNGIPDNQETSYVSSSSRSSTQLYWLGVGILITTLTYIFLITWIPIPADNQRFADTVLGFMLGTLMSNVIGYFFGNSKADFHSVTRRTTSNAPIKSKK